MTKILTITLPEETYELHLLNVGEEFEQFGMSRHPLVAGRDFATGQRHKNPTASLVVRRLGAMGVEDTEREISDPHCWNFIARCINGDFEGVQAVAAAPTENGNGRSSRKRAIASIALATVAAAFLTIGAASAQSFEHPVQAAMRDCAAGTAPEHVCETLRLAEAACGDTPSLATFACINDQIARRKVEVTPQGVTILRGGN